VNLPLLVQDAKVEREVAVARPASRRAGVPNGARPNIGHLIASVTAALAKQGLLIRGGFHPEPGEPGLEGAGTVLLIGNAGAAMWDAFAPHIDGAPDPLNRWTVGVIEPIAARFSARALYPFGELSWPFQRWAARAETLHPSPLGLLIHPEYGLWHAYRAALLFIQRLPLPPVRAAPSPCESCAEKPCMSACPVSAFTGGDYDVPACAAHIRKPDTNCVDAGCRSREVCPVGRDWRYPPEQVRFHMTAFSRAVAAAD